MGVIGNAFVIFVIAYYPKMRKKMNNMLILNQSSLDMAASISILMSAHVKYDRTDLLHDDISNLIYCKVWMSKIFMWGFFCSSTWNLVFINFERYLEIVHPFFHKAHMTNSKLFIGFGVVWFIGILLQLVIVIPTSDIINGGCLWGASFPSVPIYQLSMVVITSIQFYIPLGIMIFCYAKMFRSLNQVGIQTTKDLSMAEKARQDKFIKARVNILKTLVMVSFCFVLCWVWNPTVLLLMALNLMPNIFDIGLPYDLTVYACFLNCCINPLIYTAKYHQFQTAVRGIFCKESGIGVYESTNNTSVT